MIKILVKKISENILLSTTYVLIAVLAILGFLFYKLTVEKYSLENTLAETQVKLRESEETVAFLSNQNTDLSKNLDEERGRMNVLADQVENIKDTTSALEKLAKTDKELLQKYSKVYFLNENYTPKNLSDIPEEYLVKKDEITTIHSEVKPFLEKMIERAKRDNIDLRIISAFRSFDEQSEVKNGYTVVYGAGGANQFSADQGYSEHQLGTTVDLSTKELNLSFTNFESTPAYLWLTKNAYKYGFILSYPKGNKYYQFEPWHWRFVGVDLATDLNNDNKTFYDLDQREIDKYLIKIFD